MQGDLITEVTINRKVKVRGAPMMDGYSTSDNKNDTFIKTTHAMAKVRSKLKEQVNLLSSCVHKELSPGSRNYHGNIVTDTKEKILEYSDPLLNVSSHYLKTGV